MNLSSYICVFILILGTECFSQLLPGAKELGMSNSTIANCENVMTLFYNPAGLVKLKSREVGIFFSPSPFGLKELRNAYAAYNEPFEDFSLAIGYKNYGFELYRENEFMLGVSSNLIKKFNIGAALSFYTLAIKKYGQANFYLLNIGNNFEIDSSLTFAYAVRNIYLTDYNDAIKKPLAFETGFAYRLHNVVTTASILKELKYEVSYAIGIDYKVIKYLNIRAGFRSYPQSYSFGVGLNYLMLQFNYAGYYNFYLGLTHQVDVILQFYK